MTTSPFAAREGRSAPQWPNVKKCCGHLVPSSDFFVQSYAVPNLGPETGWAPTQHHVNRRARQAIQKVRRARMLPIGQHLMQSLVTDWVTPTLHGHEKLSEKVKESRAHTENSPCNEKITVKCRADCAENAASESRNGASEAKKQTGGGEEDWREELCKNKISGN